VDLVAAWLLYPLALAVLCLGLGLLVGRLAAWELPGLLLVPLGFATLLAVVRVVVESSATARLALPLVVLLAVAGLASGGARLRRLRPSILVAGAAAGAFLVFGAPVILSGHATFAGYLALADTSHHLGLAAQYSRHGPDVSSLLQGSEKLTMAQYIGTAYPVTGQAAMGVTAPLGLLDIAWLYQPFLSFMAIVVCLGIVYLVGPLFRTRWQPALVGFVAAQSTLVVGFAMQGSIKELTALTMFATLVALVVAGARERRPARSLLPVAITAPAALGALGPAAGPFLVVVLVAVLAVWGPRLVRGRSLPQIATAGAIAIVALALAWPMLSNIETAITVNKATLDSSAPDGGPKQEELGHLPAPLHAVQALGVWLSGDYRYRTTDLRGYEDPLLWIAGIAAALGLLSLLARRAGGPLLLVATLGLPALYLLPRGSPYADAKVLMILSTAALLLAILGATSLWRGRLKPLALLAMAAVTGGVLWSNSFEYHDVLLTPYDRYGEMLDLNDRFAGKGPAVLNEYDEFAKYFLRDLPVYSQPEWAHDYRSNPYYPNALFDPLRRPTIKTPLDMDDLRLRYLETIPLVIIRRGPTASRPPANFRRVWQGRFYDVWRRGASPQVISHRPMGPTILRPSAPVSAQVAAAWAQRARRLGGRIAYVDRRRMPAFYISHHPRPPKWSGNGLFLEGLQPDGPGHIDAPVRIPATGRYRVWFEGAFSRELSVYADHRLVGTSGKDLNNPGAYAEVGDERLTRGIHGVQVTQGGGDLAPGSGGYRSYLRHIGPIFFQPEQDWNLEVSTIAPAQWRRLVGRRVDWLEVVR
jgi:hypothetical protein